MRLDELLRDKVKAIEGIRTELVDFYRTLRTESHMSAIYK